MCFKILSGERRILSKRNKEDRSVAKTARGLPADGRVFVSASVSYLANPDLYDPGSALGEVARRIVLDVGDARALQRVRELPSRLSRLRSLGYQLAVQIPVGSCGDPESYELMLPDAVKVRLDPAPAGGARHPDERQLGRGAEWCAARGTDLIVEGVERDDQRDQLGGAGCRLFQDCFFTQPGRRLDSQH
jgi:EAL domain-containing protein (putative c-di-GMP-specific phosphodiesterase class I)